MRIERLKKRASEKKSAAFLEERQPKNQRRAELLRRRIEELDLRLDILNSERGLFEKLLGGVRRADDSRSSNSPMLWQRLRR